jgi:Flp pilus assembly protein TadG
MLASTVAERLARRGARFLQGFRRDADGAVAVELALASVLLMPLIVGTIDFGYYMNSAQTMAAATRVGAEYVRGSPNCTGTAGINYAATPPTISPACTNGLQTAMQNAFAYSSITVNSPTATNTGLTCSCDDGSAIGCGGSTVCTAPPKRMYITVSATISLNPILSWPGYPSTVNVATEVRLQ